MSTPSVVHRLSAAINAEAHELRPALSGFLLFFCLFAGYFMLRPIRESMGIAAGVENLQWLFTATFFVMLAGFVLFGAAVAFRAISEPLFVQATGDDLFPAPHPSH